jgi:hypothetical protein
VRYTVDQARALPMRALQEAGVFAKEPGLIWRCVWKSGATIVSSLRLRLETSSEHACHLRLIYFVRSSGGSPVAHDYPVSVVGATRPGRRGGTSFLSAPSEPTAAVACGAARSSIVPQTGSTSAAGSVTI